MGREKRNLPAAVAGGPKERHKRAQRSQFDHTAPVPPGFVAKPALPKATKHHSYFEFVENKDKKKKLEFEITTKKTPPPGFEFVPAGNPELTQACKELSREKDAMIFIVSNAKETSGLNDLAHQVHRIGHHIRETIVEEARASLGHVMEHMLPVVRGAPEPIPESQEEYDAQVDAALRDLFPRIPNTDRQMIIEHAFRRDPTNKGEKEKVGFSEDITLARRVHLAVLAHIRHTHTRYDTLLRETTWQNARKVVEALCLDTLVKWRGDEESGRDQLDEILREVVVISDSEGEDSGDESDSSIEEVVYQSTNPIPIRPVQNISGQAGSGFRQSPRLSQGARTPVTPKPRGKVKKAKRKTSAEKKGQRGFKRYQAWQEAIDRSRNVQDQAPQSPQGPSAQYTHGPPPPTNLVPIGEELPAASQLRLVSGGAGPAPYENGYVGKPQYPANGHFISAGPPVARKVKSPFYEAPPTTHPPVSRVADRLQDMLVRSIEPASPDTMKPSFVRAVPPRGQGFRNEPPITTNMQPPAIISSPLRGPDTRGEPMRTSRPIVGEPLVPGDRLYQFSSHDPSPSRDGMPNAPLHRYDTRSRGIQSNPARILVSRRTYDEAQRFGDRDKRVVMEDRGGFYERVPVRSTGDLPNPSLDERAPEYRPTPEPYRAPREHQAIPWQEGSRLPSGSRNNVPIEIIPISRAPLDDRQRPVLADPRGVPSHVPAPSGARGDIRSFFEREPRPVRYNPPASEPRPVMNEPLASRYEPFLGVRREERMPDTYQHQEPVHRYYREEPVITADGRRPPTLHPRRMEDVIVLE
ncbi:hypothetical protein F53441_6166 [Fusarium austroafricanum]|uniref:DUF2293 domain-containing protein n=1 Tax=Fusarium austroafricanum TaxID=2364996 RepID=A0A8H4NYW6_9HYPO|nr:hypothetical protein F53441_6166 [Fusarium austroafricanum]